MAYDLDHEGSGRRTPKRPSGAVAAAAGRPHIKTPSQKKALEQAFSINQYPSDDVRRELGERLDLSANQIQVWFNHRRRKAKDDEALAKVRGEQASISSGGRMADYDQPSSGSEDEETEDEGTDPTAHEEAELLEIIEMAKARLGIQFREDGPPLAFEFDDPPAAPSKSAGGSKRKRVNTKHGEGEMLEDGTFVTASKRSRPTNKKAAQLEEKIRKRQEEEDQRREKMRIEQEKRAKREAERALQLQQKLEQAMRKEAERKERERQREIERMQKEAAKEEQRRQKEEEKLRLAEEREKQREALAQERERQRLLAQQERERKKEAERLEKQRLADERRREAEKRKAEKDAEKERRAEERRREREMQRALAAQEKAALKAKQREAGIGFVEDEELEWEEIIKARHDAGYGSDTDGANPPDLADVQRPPFPPTEIVLKRAFASALKEVGPDLIMVWSFCTSFPELLGLWPSIAAEDLLLATVEGFSSRLLAETHIALIRLALADMEESHAKGATHQALNVVDRAVYNAAHTLEEAWAWGFETDVWRAHLSAMTWPEVLREMAIAAGHGRRRPENPATAPQLGQEGEDVVDDSMDDGLRLRRPARLLAGTIRAAAWLVLSREGPAGLTVNEIAQHIAAEELFDFSNTKTPEASVAVSLSRDLLFYRVAPGTYALTSVVSYSLRLDEARGGGDEGQEEGGDGPSFRVEVIDEDIPEEEREEDEELEGDDGDDESLPDTAESWVLQLEDSEYNELSLADRVKALVLLVQMVIDGPTLRARLEARMDESAKVKKHVQEENKQEKRRKQAEAAAKAAEVAREAMKALEKQKPEIEGITREGEGDSGQAEKDSITEAAKKAMAEAETRIKQEGEGQPIIAEVEKRRKERAEAVRRAEDATAIRFKPMGLDRRRNKYWRFVQFASPAEDRSVGRVFIEDAITGEWGLIADEDSVQILVNALLQRGVREGPLYRSLKRSEGAIQKHMPCRGFALPAEREAAIVAQEQAAWLTTQCTNAAVAIHTGSSHNATHVLTMATPPSAMPLAKVKQDLLEVEAALPPEATDHAIDRALWREQLESAESAEGVRRCLGELELSLSPSILSPEYRLRPHLIKGAWVPCGKEVYKIPGPNEEAQYILELSEELSDPLQWLPATVPSIALRVLALDASLLFAGCEAPARDHMAAYRYIRRPTPPVAMGVGAKFHLEGHTHGDVEYVSSIFSSPYDEERPMLFPQFPAHVMDEGDVPFDLPVDIILAQRFVPEARQPMPRARPGGRGSGAVAASGTGRKGRGGRGAAASGGRTPRSGPPSKQSKTTPSNQGPHTPSDYNYGSEGDEEEDEAEGKAGESSDEGSDDEGSDQRSYEESESPEISDMDSD
mmetsp:Transcript_4546/g.12680  ORF Transcript_4546/g.12680 Transcript_4546/m.12680 type:complete len:1365 (+) Transcript_4546:425-4519(+)